jgi:salicylate hydroxylase
VIEQAPELREIGAGIQLGPNIFRALERIGLKEAVLADAHLPPAMEMRCALSGERVTRIPLADPRFLENSTSLTPSPIGTTFMASSSGPARTTI